MWVGVKLKHYLVAAVAAVAVVAVVAVSVAVAVAAFYPHAFCGSSLSFHLS